MAIQQRVLVVDDELSMREVLEIVLENAGYEVVCTSNVEGALGLMEEEQFDVVLTDLYMGSDRNAGMQLLSWIEENAPTVPAIMMTAHGSVESAIEAMRRGATDYIQKPFKNNDEIRVRIERAIAQRNLLRENTALRKEQTRHNELSAMIGKSPALDQVRNMIRRVATLPSTVAIHGDSGAGKELVARELHNLSDRAEKPFVAINCGGIPENLLESELFGHKRGAFTGAIEDKEGLFVVANGGTLFLDEIGEMPLVLQVKLLRVLDNNLVTPVGGTTAAKVDVRVISATNRDLEAMAEDGDFRKDLYYRLNVIPLYVPPLRKRADDIPLLARHFLKRHGEKMGRDITEMAPEVDTALRQYPWPGNVRELGNVIERAMALCAGERIELDDLPPAVRDAEIEAPQKLDELPEGGMDLEETMADIEMGYIKQALERTKYSQRKAAEMLGLTPRSLRYRLQKHELEAH